MEAVWVKCTSTDDVLDRLNVFGAFWSSQRMFEYVAPIWNTVWKSRTETLAVFVYAAKASSVILKVEYVHNSPTCKIEIASLYTADSLAGPGNVDPGREATAKALLADLFSVDQEELYTFALDHHIVHLLSSERGQVQVFECPHCGARYAKRRLRRQSDGSVQCQNCNRWIPSPPSSPEEQKPE